MEAMKETFAPYIQAEIKLVVDALPAFTPWPVTHGVQNRSESDCAYYDMTYLVDGSPWSVDIEDSYPPGEGNKFFEGIPTKWSTRVHLETGDIFATPSFHGRVVRRNKGTLAELCKHLGIDQEIRIASLGRLSPLGKSNVLRMNDLQKLGIDPSTPSLYVRRSDRDALLLCIKEAFGI